MWNDAALAKDAASALGITSDRLLQLGLVDEVIPEPLGGAHKDPEQVADQVGECLAAQLEELDKLTTESLLEERYQRLLSYGEFKD